MTFESRSYASREGDQTRSVAESLDRLAPCLLTLLAALALFTMGCGTAPRAHVMSQALAEANLRLQPLNHVVVPFELTPEMRSWADEVVPKDIEELRTLESLAQSLLNDKHGLSIRYERGETGTAQSVFETGQANCLSFTHTFVGFARYLGIPVHFLEVRDIQTYDREGDLIVHSDHIAVGYGPGHELTIIDFAEQQGSSYHQIRAISDLEAITLFYSNRGAELLRAGEVDQALEWLEDAVRISDSIPGAWINLGVAQRRAGSVEDAMASYRRALEIDPGFVSAYQNLAALLRMRGKHQEAYDLLSAVDRSGNRNPYSFLVLGDLSRRYGRDEEAERFYRRAARVNQGQSEPLAALGLLAYERGDLKSARRLLKRARRLDSRDNERVAELSAQLGEPPR